MAGWNGGIEELLYDGESIRERVDVGDSRVVVTSHRILAFTPETDGANFSQVDRPNVDGVETGGRGNESLLVRGIQAGVVGLVLIGAGWLLDFGAIIGDVDLTGGGAAGQLGIGSVLGTLQRVLVLLRNLDQYMQLFGALALLLAVALVGIYWWLREQTLVIRVAGGDDVHVPRPPDATAAADQLEHAITPLPGSEPRETPDRNDDPLDEA